MVIRSETCETVTMESGAYSSAWNPLWTIQCAWNALTKHVVFFAVKWQRQLDAEIRLNHCCILSANRAEHGGKIQNLWDCYHWKWSLELSMEPSMNNPVFLKWTDKTSGLFAVQWQRQALEPGTKKHSRKIATQKEQLQMKLPLD